MGDNSHVEGESNMLLYKAYQIRCMVLASVCACVCSLTGCTLEEDVLVSNSSSHKTSVYLKYVASNGANFSKLIGTVPSD